MPCCGDREKGPTKQSQKWEYITLSDFKSTSAWNTPAYVWLWILFISTVVIYVVDTFTAVNLLVFNKWSSQVQPYIAFSISKWIFAGCIIFSWILWAFEWLRAVRVIRAGGVAASYMDPLAVSLQSMRGQGWRRFLVFAELTKSKKGMDLVAFFVYFAFKGSIRIIVAEGPRQVINVLTLIAVVKADFVDGQSNKNLSGISLFWSNLQKMYNANHLEAVIIFSMMYSLLIWLISVICLAIAAIMYIVFLWHYIPQQDGGLSKYCRRKIDKRLERIVESKVKAAIEEEERQKRKAEEKEWKAAQRAEKKGKKFDAAPMAPGIARQPTLPQLDGDHKDDASMDGYSLRRTDTNGSVATLPAYASRPGTRNEDRPPLPTYNSARPLPLRSATNGSQWTTASYESDAPLLANAAQNGESLPMRPPTAFRQDSNASYGRAPTPRAMTPGSVRPYSPAAGRPGADVQQRAFSPMLRTDFSQGGAGPQSARSDTPYSARSEAPYRGPSSPRSGTAAFDRELPGPPRAASTTPYDGEVHGPPRVATSAPFDRPGTAGPPRAATGTSFDRPSTVAPRQPSHTTTNSTASFSRPLASQKPSHSYNRPFSPATTDTNVNSYEMKSNPYISRTPVTESPSSYVAFKPNRSASPAPQPPALMRSNTGMTEDYFSHKGPGHTPNRSLTAPTVDNNRTTFGYSDLVDDYSTTSSSADGAHKHPGSHPHF